MRKIPETVTDDSVISKLNEISVLIEAKMKVVKTLKDSAQLQDLKKVSVEIDTLDKEWKALAGI